MNRERGAWGKTLRTTVLVHLLKAIFNTYLVNEKESIHSLYKLFVIFMNKTIFKHLVDGMFYNKIMN